MHIPGRLSSRPLSRRVLLFVLVAAPALGVASLLAYNGIGPLPAQNADELAGMAAGMILMALIQGWANGLAKQ